MLTPFWNTICHANDTLDQFNAVILPLMREHPKFKVFAHAFARRRGWRYNKEAGVYE